MPVLNCKHLLYLVKSHNGLFATELESPYLIAFPLGAPYFNEVCKSAFILCGNLHLHCLLAIFGWLFVSVMPTNSLLKGEQVCNTHIVRIDGQASIASASYSFTHSPKKQGSILTRWEYL